MIYKYAYALFIICCLLVCGIVSADSGYQLSTGQYNFDKANISIADDNTVNFSSNNLGMFVQTQPQFTTNVNTIGGLKNWINWSGSNITRSNI